MKSEVATPLETTETDEQTRETGPDGPFWNPVIRRWVGRGELDYEVYVRTNELLALQTSASELSRQEELSFQIVHQTQELWLKLVAFEGVAVEGALDASDLWQGAAAAARMTRVLACMREGLRVLETMTPNAFQTIRRNLGNGSGLESPGYNAVRAVGVRIDAALARLMSRSALTLEAVYSEDGDDDSILRVCEELVDVDTRFQEWLVGHFFLVRRTLGVDRRVAGLDGFPTNMLASRMTMPLFRTLWDVRVEMTSKWQREGGFLPGERRKAK